jgi:hypothetical protein
MLGFKQQNKNDDKECRIILIDGVLYEVCSKKDLSLPTCQSFASAPSTETEPFLISSDSFSTCAYIE